MKIQKKNMGVGGDWVGWGSGWGVRVDANEELKFLGKFTKPEDQWSCKRSPDILA